MTQENFSYVGRAVDKIYATKTNEETEELLKQDVPMYDPCDTTLDTQYDSKFKNEHSDKELPYKGNFCLDKPVKTVIKDKPFTPPEECCCCCNVKPEPEKAFVRPVGNDCTPDTHKEIPCDSRVATITRGHYANEEMDTVAKEYFENEQDVVGKKETTNFHVSQPNTNEETTTNSVGSNDGTAIIEGNVQAVPAEAATRESDTRE